MSWGWLPDSQGVPLATQHQHVCQMEDKPSLSMAGSEERNRREQGHSSERVPFPPRLDSEICRHPADPSRAWNYPVSPGSPDLRMLMEETAFQSLAEEASLRRRCPDDDVSPQGEDNLLSLPFPQKLWRLVNSNQFSSIWWDDGGTCLGVNEKLFQKEILERDVPDKVFATDSLRSFLRQLNLYGFRKQRQRTFRTLTDIFPAQQPVSILNKVMNDKPLGGLSRWALGPVWVEVPGLPPGKWATSGGVRGAITVVLCPPLGGGDTNQE